MLLFAVFHDIIHSVVLSTAVAEYTYARSLLLRDPAYFMKQIKQHPLIFGTFILTVTGLITRLIGFFYRIYLSRLFGEEGMGIYQLLSPALSLSFSLTAAGYQTAISKYVAANTSKSPAERLRPLLAGVSITLPLSFLTGAVMFLAADPIGVVFLKEARTVPMLRILSFSIPFAALHACINGYFYGKKKAAVPAVTQLLEQIARVGCVYLVTGRDLMQGRTPSISVAVLGLTVGEILSMLMALLCLYVHLYYHQFSRHTEARLSAYSQVITHPAVIPSPASSPTTHTPRVNNPSVCRLLPTAAVYRDLLGMVLPLTANRIVLNILQSIEAVSIPQKLLLYGYDTTTALSVYGVLTGMAMPMIFFPNALTSSVAVLLLPTISENHARGDRDAVLHDTLRTVKYCGLMGFSCLCCFLFLGKWMGSELFHSELAGHFIVNLGFICPFLYLDTTLSGILQGLGMAGRIFLSNVICLLLRLTFVFFAIPIVGMQGYLWGILVSQLALAGLYFYYLYRFFQIRADSK